MFHTDDNDPCHKLRVKFCDDTSAEKTFEATTYGGLVAREEYQELLDKGNENGTVWEQIPHITQVQLFMDESETPVFEVFECSCKKEAKVSA